MPLTQAQQELLDTLDALVTRAATSCADTGTGRKATCKEVLLLFHDVLDKNFRLIEDPFSLPKVIARDEGYDIPPFAFAGCGEMKEFFSDKGVANVPGYLALWGISRETYRDLYAYVLVLVRNRSYRKRVFLVPVKELSTLSARFAHDLHEMALFVKSHNG